MNKLLKNRFRRGILTILLPFMIAGTSQAQQKDVIALEYKESRLPFGLNEKVVAQQPSVALVLSGGGARGLAQIGVLRALSEHEIPVSLIVGTSMGSIIGGLYSAGYSIQDLDSIVRVIPWSDLMTSTEETNRKDLFVDQKVTEDKALVAFRLEGLHLVLPTSITTGQRLSNLLNLLALNAPIHVNSDFDELKYSFRAVCTDLVTGNLVMLNHGSLSQAMRASSSVSLLVSPVKIDSLLLVDGGLVANIPVQLAKDSGSDLTIAFNTTSPLNTAKELDYPWNVADQLVSIPMRLLTEQQLKAADIVVSPKIGNKKNTDFTGIDSIIYKGYASTLPLIGTIEEKIKELYRTKLKEKEFYVKNVVYDENAPQIQRAFLYKYSRKDSVGSHEILSDLASIYSSGDYDSLSVGIRRDEAGSHLNFIFKKNPTINKVSVGGLTLFSRSIVDSLFDEVTGRPYNANRVLEKLLSVMKLYRSSGYSLAEVEHVAFDPETGELKVRISEGKIARIVIEGNRKTRDDIIRREFPLSEGDYFLSGKIEQGLANLRGTNLFSDVTITAAKNTEENVLYLKVDEKPSSLMRFGLRIDNENQTQLSLDLRDENIAGSGTELGLILSGGIRNRSYILEHKANRIFNSYLTYKVRAFYEFNDVYTYKMDEVRSERYFSRSVDGEYRQISQGFSLGLGMQVKKYGNLIIQGKYEGIEVKNKRDYKGGTYKTQVSSVEASSTIDSQDKYPFPNYGFLIKASYETAQKLFFSDLGYSKFYIDYTSYFTTYNKVHTITPHFAFGFADETLPLSQQFSLGGQNSFFGLRDNEFRGRQLFLASIQYRAKLPVKLFFDAYLKVRYDMGSVWQSRAQMRFVDFMHGMGTSVSFDTPLGPADFSVGRSFLFERNLPNNPLRLGPVYFYFTIGYYY
ncbi:MAG: BamA/TamA family outer membrane protein [Ignavibacteria bacterium]|jgi:NTE family protein|nr:BamA/TamA family outer membrane protein [Ignavibacteria bacterium]MCU7498513.1 BamA/TamA family outer membrane protein [Ignavibacteria bacterium]MCU7513537.1 BamA/TamA family outer membrane protein [Ignavibacteria bacterium]MCU7521900.1 BamA/TamA family outer membrane protein [Ignavibacteria bacterium]MCU7525246.1 BamA/TamA family outer membrane protein [Ignavibacteria bacterium]